MRPSALTLLILSTLLSSCGNNNAASKDTLQAALPQDAGPGPACVPTETTFVEVLGEGTYDMDRFSENLHGRAAQAGLLTITNGTRNGPLGTYPVKIINHTNLYREIQAKIKAGQLCYGTFGHSVIDSFEVTDEKQKATAKVSRSLKRDPWATETVTSALGIRVPDPVLEMRFKRTSERWILSEGED